MVASIYCYFPKIDRSSGIDDTIRTYGNVDRGETRRGLRALRPPPPFVPVESKSRREETVREPRAI